MKLYMAITQDKYALPIAISESCRGLERQLGLKASSIASYIYHIKSGRIKTKYPRYISVEIEGTFWGCNDGQKNKAAFEGIGIDCLSGDYFVFCSVLLVF